METSKFSFGAHPSWSPLVETAVRALCSCQSEQQFIALIGFRAVSHACLVVPTAHEQAARKAGATLRVRGCRSHVCNHAIPDHGIRAASPAAPCAA